MCGSVHKQYLLFKHGSTKLKTCHRQQYLTLIRLRSRVRCFHFTAITVSALVPQIKQLTHDNAQTWLLVHL